MDMATGGSFSRSFEKGSAEDNENCTPCLKDNKEVIGIKFCSDCREFLCKRCFRDHNKFAALRTHRILDTAELQSFTSHGVIASQSADTTSIFGGNSSETADTSTIYAIDASKTTDITSVKCDTLLGDRLTERCLVHRDMMIDTFCCSHDVVTCTSCIFESHSSCQDITGIHDASNGVTKTAAYKDILADIATMRSNFKRLKLRKNEIRAKIEKEKKASIDKIETTRIEICKRINDLAEDAIESVVLKHRAMEMQLNHDIDALEELFVGLNASVDKLKKADPRDEQHAFVSLKVGEDRYRKGMDMVEEMQSNTEFSINFKTNKDITDFLLKFKSVGDISNEQSENVSYSAALVDRLSIKVEDDSRDCCSITGVCYLPDESILCADFTNCSLKRLSPSYIVVDRLILSDRPQGVCSAGKGTVAVAIQEFSGGKIQIVSLRGSHMTHLSHFNFGPYCYGVAFNNGLLYSSCADGFHSSQARLKTNKITGELVNTFQKTKAGQPLFSTPRQIAISYDGSSIHVANGDGVVIVDPNGARIAYIADPNLTDTRGLSLGRDGDMFVCDNKSNTVVHINKAGTKCVLLTEADGVNQPRSVSFDPIQSHLIVAMNSSDHIQVFRLSYI